MRGFAQPFIALAGLLLSSFPVSPANAAPMPSACASTQITSIRKPSGPAAYQGGRITLANGATLAVTGPLKSADMYRVSEMQAGDRVLACHGKPTTYADAGPSRTVTILDLRSNGYYGTLVGTW